MTRVWLAWLWLAAPAAAMAQPRLVPAGNVDVLYRVAGAAAGQIPGGAPDGVRLQWDAATRRLRSEPVGGPVYAITDLGHHTADIVFTAQSAYLELPIRGDNPQALLGGVGQGMGDAQFARRGTAHVLGLECTEWTVQSRRLDATGCVTADGVVLRADGLWDGQAGSVVAVSVTREAVPAARFQPPEGFFRVGLKGAR